MFIGETRVKYHLVESSEIDSHDVMSVGAKPTIVFDFLQAEPMIFRFRLG